MDLFSWMFLIFYPAAHPVGTTDQDPPVPLNDADIY